MNESLESAMYRIFLAVVCIDGEQHPAEIAMVKHIASIGGEKHLKALDDAVKAFFSKETSNYSIDEVIGFATSGLMFLTDAAMETKQLLITNCIKIVTADRKIHDDERRLVLTIAEALGMNKETREKINNFMDYTLTILDPLP